MFRVLANANKPIGQATDEAKRLAEKAVAEGKAHYNSSGNIVPGAYAMGGIFTRPTLGIIGEAGPEAVIPLSKMGGMGGGVNVTIQAGAFMGSREDARSFARMLQELMRNENNTRTYGRLV